MFMLIGEEDRQTHTERKKERKRERERERKKEREQRAGETQQARLENPRLDKESGRLKIKKGRRIVGCNKTNDCLE